MIFAERRDGNALGIVLERAEIVLCSSHHRHMLDAALALEGIEHVAEHGPVETYVLVFIGAARPCAIEDVGRIEMREALHRFLPIKDIEGDRVEIARAKRRPPGDPVDLPPPCSARCSATFNPTMPVTPTIKARF